ncbi:MAG: hypothetical protein DRG11_06230 [Epsilonproteobacteria bacterium]|nr:MAG: hypothetical protein DRG11_06230 [Campylobacterota bacterium]
MKLKNEVNKERIMLRKIKKIILLVVILGIISLVYENIINRHFPFISMDYQTYNQFNSQPKFSSIDISLDINNKISKKIRNSIKIFKKTEFGDLEDDIKAVTIVTRNIMHKSEGNIIRKISDVLSEDKKYKNICSESSKIFVTLMQSIGYPARVIWMEGHTVSEIYTKKDGWILVDAYWNLIFKDKKGKYQSLLAINRNFNNIKPFNIINKKYKNNLDYLENGYIFKERNIYNDQNLFVVIEGKSLDNFHEKTRNINNILNAVFLNNQFTNGIQFIKEDSKKVGNVGISFTKRF